MQKSLEINEEKFPLGIIYQKEKPSYTDQLPQLKENTLVDKKDLPILIQLQNYLFNQSKLVERLYKFRV